MIEKFTVGFIKDLDIVPEEYKFKPDLLLVKRNHKLIQQYIEPLFAKGTALSECLSNHDKKLIESCDCCLLHSYKHPEGETPEKYFYESRLLFIFLIEALRLIGPSKAVDLFIFELEKINENNFKLVNTHRKKKPFHKLDLRRLLYDADDLNSAKKIFDRIYGLYKSKAKIRNRLVHAIILYNKSIFVEDPDISYLMLMTLLECLFSPPKDKGELTYLLANRIVWFLTDSPEQRKKYFMKIKKMYSHRSKIIHGADVDDTLIKGVDETISELREICRRCLEKIFYNDEFYFLFSSKKDDIEAYLQELTLNLA